MTDMPEHIVERVARAICRADGWNPDYSHITANGESFFNWMFFRGKAIAAIKALGGELGWCDVYEGEVVGFAWMAEDLPNPKPALLIKLEGE